MNRRQEIASWVFGLLAAVASNAEGQRHDDWLFMAVVPLLIVGLLLVYSLRTRVPENERKAAQLLSAGVGLVVLFSGYGHLLSRVSSAEYAIDNAQSSLSEEIGEATKAAEAAKDSAEEAKLAADEAKDEAEAAKHEAEEAKDETTNLELQLGR